MKPATTQFPARLPSELQASHIASVTAEMSARCCVSNKAAAFGGGSGELQTFTALLKQSMGRGSKFGLGLGGETKP